MKNKEDIKVFQKSKLNRQNKMQEPKSRLNGLIPQLRSVRRRYNRNYENENA